MLDANPRLVQQINFTGNIEQFGDTKMILILEEIKGSIVDISKGTVKVL